MTLIQAQNTAKTADLDVIFQGTVTVNYHMSGVTMTQVLHSGENPSPNAEAQPLESIVLSFKKLKYTFQPVLPNGQKNGPPVSVNWSFK